MSQILSVGDAIAQFCGLWLRIDRRASKTVQAYSTDLQQFATALPPGTSLATVSRKDIEAWILGMHDHGYKRSSIRRKLSSIRAFFRQCVDRGLLDESPLTGFVLRLGKATRLLRLVQASDLDKLFEHFRTAVSVAHVGSVRHVVALRNLAILRLLCATGIRVGELTSLKCEDRFQVDRLRIMGKGGSERIAFLILDEDRACLDTYMDIRQRLAPTSDFVFLNAHGNALSTEGVRRVLRKAAEAVGIDLPITPHMLRHRDQPRACETVEGIVFVLAHALSMEIIEQLVGEPELSVTEIARRLDLAVSSVSKSLRRLRDNRMVERRRERNTWYYRLATDIRIASHEGRIDITFTAQNGDQLVVRTSSAIPQRL